VKRGSPKRFEELPTARIIDICAGEKDAVLLKLQFDSNAGVVKGGGSLLWKTTECLEAVSGTLSTLSEGGIAEFVSSVEDAIDWGQRKVRYLCEPWAPHHVWMISVPTWHFDQQEFKASDAMGERCPASAAPPPPTGEPVHFWLKVTSPTSSGKHRFYPNDQRAEGLVTGAWDHEHCEFCDEHIVPGDVAYVDFGDHWVCKECYAQFVRR
jgi:hypothetical protein